MEKTFKTDDAGPNPMTIIDRECERCAGSGEVGINAQTGTYLAPGPVPDDARGVASVTCCRCNGSGVIEVVCETIVGSGSWSDLFALAKEIDEHISNNSDLELSTPVSYTHLDVYKRQPSRRVG